MHRSLVCGRVQRLTMWRVGTSEVALLNVRCPPRTRGVAGETFRVLAAAGLGIGICTPDEVSRLRLAAGSPSAHLALRTLWRASLLGAHIVRTGTMHVEVAARGQRWRLDADTAASLSLVEVGPLAGAPADAFDTNDAKLEDLEERGARFVDRLAGDAADERRRSIGARLRRALARLERRADAVRGDLSRAHEARAAAERARTFVAAAARAPRGARRLEAVDWTTGEARVITMEIDPIRSAREQLEVLFKRARRLGEGAAIAQRRLDDTERALDALRSLSAAVESSAPVDLDGLEARARAAAPYDFRIESAGSPASAHRSRPGARVPHRTFVASAGARVLVGRSAIDNETLTFRVGRAHDLWLHARDKPGSHVIVPLDRGASCPAKLLVEAAHLAAHFSGARGEPVVDVQYALRGHVRKIRGGAPGSVVVDGEKVLALRFDDSILRRLLHDELAP